MDIYEMIQKRFGSIVNHDCDFSLIELDENLMVGIDKDLHICVVVNSTNPNEDPVNQRTRSISIECNAKVQYELNGNFYKGVAHIIRCLSTIKKEQELFIELALVLIRESGRSKEKLLETFYILRDFFKESKEISENELVGLYAELYTIFRFHESLQIEKYWQSRDKMKFDFSFSSKIKLDVKTTVKDIRMHHFRHEQLTNDLYQIYILSYQLRYDDEGYSLFDLLLKCKKLVENDSRKLIRINYILKNVEENRLRNLKFNTEYTEAFRRFYRAEDIPRFEQIAPQGVVNIEYDSILDNAPYIDDDTFINTIKLQLKEGNNV